VLFAEGQEGDDDAASHNGVGASLESASSHVRGRSNEHELLALPLRQVVTRQCEDAVACHAAASSSVARVARPNAR